MLEYFYKPAALLSLVVIALFIGYTLRERDKDRGSRINLEDLVLDEKGKLSGRACVMLGAFLMSTWLIIYLALRDKLTEEYFGYYMAAWVAPTVTKFIFHKPEPVKARKPDPNDQEGD